MTAASPDEHGQPRRKYFPRKTKKKGTTDAGPTHTSGDPPGSAPSPEA